MNFKEYQDKCLETAIYPNIGNNHIYPFLGLVGEFGEFCEKAEHMTNATIDDLLYENGDCWWYIVMLLYELKIEGGDLDADVFDSGEGDYNGSYTLDKINISISKLAELFKKQIRDNSELNRKQIIGWMSHIIMDLVRYIVYRGWDFDEILQMNVDKLSSRKERNVIHGSGDNR